MTEENANMPEPGPIDGPLCLNEKDFQDSVMGAGVLLRQWAHARGKDMTVGEAMGEVGALLNDMLEQRHISIAEGKNLLMLAATLGLIAERRGNL